jgi:hypothetical protein
VFSLLGRKLNAPASRHPSNGGGSNGSTNDAICAQVLKQKEKETINFFAKVSDLREFITAAQPAPDVNITSKI